ncbi:hypothetical protein ONZ51_g10696 [Trametes cubensis]|uniref:HAT C-terminal dimerisation domain-containing protein n=1 Tax=Trametes cubensis TaxID=1111947 RepID=A0AAD7TIY7_9APHY|nr:hypothetical protein ONZ51_g10696 [Trametes cubensis]
MLPIIENGLFWHSVVQVKKHLEPLAIATNVTQSDNCRLDEVLITFGVLLHAFDSLNDSQQIIKDAVIASLEKRWDKSDQDVFIAAVILNPFIRTQPFQHLPELFTPAAIYLLLQRLWTRFYPDTPVPADFYTSVISYLSEDGQFATLSKTITAVTNAAKAQGLEAPSPVMVWRDHTIPGKPIPALHALAIHIYSICPNSANCERLFSALGLIMTKLRNRMGHKTLMNIAELLMHLRDEHSGGEQSIPMSDGPPAARASAQVSSASASGGFEALASALSGNNDDDTDLPDTPAFPSEIRKTLRMLLDFEAPFWRSKLERTSTPSLDDELALWEILDMDADGEEVGAQEVELDDLANALMNA